MQMSGLARTSRLTGCRASCSGVLGLCLGCFLSPTTIKNFKTELNTRERLRLCLPPGGRSNCAGCMRQCEEVPGALKETPGGHAQRWLPGVARVPQPALGCVACKVNLCVKCRKPVAEGGWDHVGYCDSMLPPVSG